MNTNTLSNDFRIDQLSVPQPMRIVDIQIENLYTKTFILDGSLEANPGQFVMVWLPDREDKPFSLVNANPITLTIAAVGPFTQALHQQQVGDYIWLRGPYGQGYQLPSTPSEHLLLIGESYFVGSLLFLARQAKAAGYQFSVLLLAGTQSDLTLVAAFKALEVPLHLFDQSNSISMIIRDISAEFSYKPTAIYGSGSIETLQPIALWGDINNIPTQLAWKAPMKCGLGVCGSCELGSGWLTCVDGPVLSFDPITTSPPYKL